MGRPSFRGTPQRTITDESDSLVIFGRLGGIMIAVTATKRISNKIKYQTKTEKDFIEGELSIKFVTHCACVYINV